MTKKTTKPANPTPDGANGAPANGRDPTTGRFLLGNPGGAGNPYAKRTAELRATMMDAVSVDDLRAIIAKLIEQAKAGDVMAAREVLDRVVGKPKDDTTGRPIVIACYTETQARFAAAVSERTGGLAPTPEQMLEIIDEQPMPGYLSIEDN